MHYNFIHKPSLCKFEILKTSILEINLFHQKNEMKRFFNIFYLSQKVYRGFSKLARIFKLKKAKFYDTDTDLFMIPFTNYKSYMLIDIYNPKNSIFYKFKITDLITIINGVLCYSTDFFIEVQDIKNPYAQIYHLI